eukprot:symbB.v1.2.030585.t1/scaffold3464.1/size56234/8
MALTFATNEFVLLAISGNGETVFSHKFPACFDRRCCATCYEAPCYGLKKDLELSWRGIYECIQCEPGDFCNGCDTFTRCPDNTQPTREGPRVSRAGSTRIADCESCAAGMEASFKHDRCVAQYTHVCSEEFIQRCIRSCKAEEPARGKKLTACEQIKCEMYCIVLSNGQMSALRLLETYAGTSQPPRTLESLVSMECHQRWRF